MQHSRLSMAVLIRAHQTCAACVAADANRDECSAGRALSPVQLESYRDRGFLSAPQSVSETCRMSSVFACRLGLPILDGDDLASAQQQFNEMVAERTDPWLQFQLQRMNL